MIYRVKKGKIRLRLTVLNKSLKLKFGILRTKALYLKFQNHLIFFQFRIY